MADSKKRGPGHREEAGRPAKKHNSRQWRAPRQNESCSRGSALGIEPGDSGIWVSCDIQKEGKCIAELQDIFDQYVEKLYTEENRPDAEAINAGKVDIEHDILQEVEMIKKARSEKPFQFVRLDVQCVIFVKTRSPIEPVTFVHHICHDAFASRVAKLSRVTRRLTPMTLMARATETGLEELARTVLAPHFHQSDGNQCPRKVSCSDASQRILVKDPFLLSSFAIRPTIRNHNTLSRDTIIQRVASIVGPFHKVDLKNYDLMIVVDVFKVKDSYTFSVCGMSVVREDFDQLKRFNLAEIYEPSPLQEAARTVAVARAADSTTAPPQALASPTPGGDEQQLASLAAELSPEKAE
ncbi:MAG: hypothetical protein M1829_000946 [Trizodia sp. TS-e1964]|nr:MAG: hypothetical protein M1829_000946 [Trizodia sp. TS-e1964]